MPLPSEAARRALLRFVAAAVLLATLAAGFQGPLVRGTLPLMRAWLGLVDSTYRTVDLSMVQFEGQTMVQRVVTPVGPHAVGGRVVLADPRTRIESRVAAGIVLQAPVLAAALLLAWPWRGMLELAVRLIAAALLLPLLILLDVPMMLYGTAWQREMALADPEGFSPLVAWADIMNAGGRFVLAVVAAAIAVLLGSRGRS